jgi:hypothetical protein
MKDALRLRDVEIGETGGDVRIKGWFDQEWRVLAGFD